MRKARFELGRVVSTKRIGEEMEKSPSFLLFVRCALDRHANADWGDLPDADAERNDRALKSREERLFSAYNWDDCPDGKIWIITEWGRSVTAILFPSEY